MGEVPGHHPGPWQRRRPGTQERAAAGRAAGRSRGAFGQTPTWNPHTSPRDPGGRVRRGGLGRGRTGQPRTVWTTSAPAHSPPGGPGRHGTIGDLSGCREMGWFIGAPSGCREMGQGTPTRLRSRRPGLQGWTAYGDKTRSATPGSRDFGGVTGRRHAQLRALRSRSRYFRGSPECWGHHLWKNG